MNNSTDIGAEINYAPRIIALGGVVAFPTDTYYGLGCDPFNAQAVERIYEIKSRPGNKAILLLIDDLASLTKCIALPPANSLMHQRFARLQADFWPGPLTIVLPAVPALPDNLVSATRTVGVRWPDYRLARQFAAAVGGVITATSANLSGQPNISTVEEVSAQLGDRVDYILNGGTTAGGAPSSVIDLTLEPPQIVRAGAIAAELIEAVLAR